MKKNALAWELAAELAGTAILILFGTAVVAQVSTNAKEAVGDHDSIAWCWGIGVILGVYVAARISGAHLNPAVTLAMATFRDFEWRKVLPFIAAQTTGAFLAAIVVRFTYSDLIHASDPHHTVKTQGIFSTLPGNGAAPVSITNAFFDQVVGTAILVFVIFALTEKSNDPPLANLAPVVIGFCVVGIGMAWGANAGYAINPARDFGPRLASFVTGYSGAWRDQHGTLYFWVPIVGPFLGGLVGGGLFTALIGRGLAQVQDEPEPEPEPTPETAPIAGENAAR